jgi:hypothetical protein
MDNDEKLETLEIVILNEKITRWRITLNYILGVKKIFEEFDIHFDWCDLISIYKR